MNQFLFDWLSFTTKCSNTFLLTSFLGFTGVTWQNLKGMYGYADRLYFDGINIHYNGRDDMGIWVEMSGKGCRAFETYGTGDWLGLLEWILSEPEDNNLTRLDIAFDDRSGLLDWLKLLRDSERVPGEDDEGGFRYDKNEHIVSKFDEARVEVGKDGASIYHGSRGSDTMIRIYDKAAQLKKKEHWIRTELQLRDKQAWAFAEIFVKDENRLASYFLGVIKNYLRYVEPQSGDTNNRRWPMTDYWKRFLKGAQAIRLYSKPGVEYNMLDLEHFVMKQAGNAIDTYIQICGEERFIEKLRVRGTYPSVKYLNLISKYKNVIQTAESSDLYDESSHGKE